MRATPGKANPRGSERSESHRRQCAQDCRSVWRGRINRADDQPPFRRGKRSRVKRRLAPQDGHSAATQLRCRIVKRVVGML
jgi:hypothetical protein